MDMKLNGRRALVTGSSAGIGEAIAHTLAEEGCSIIVHGRSGDRARQVRDDLRAKGAQAEFIVGDVTSDDDLDRMAAEALRAFGGVDILINNAGAYPFTDWWSGSTEEWTEAFKLEVIGPVRLIQKIVPHMVQQGWGRVIQISSASVPRSPANFFPIYSISKAAQTFMAGHLAVELTRTGVTVNTVSPGPCSSRFMMDGLAEQARQQGRPDDDASLERFYIDNLMQEPPVDRLLRPEEVGPLVAYVCSPLADGATGQNFILDCGYGVTGFKRFPTEIPKPEPIAAE